MTALAPLPTRRPTRALDVEIVVPVFNEEAALERSVRRLHRFLSDGFPFSWRIVVADNASTDATPEIAARLAGSLPGVSVLRLDRKGRGRALRAAWSVSEARVVAYMDVDLSTDLRGLLPLVAPLLSGHSDLAIGTRLAHGARVVRGPKRELISRGYNHILHAVLRARFSDAQCGFKAARTSALGAGLLDEVRDDGWFFDTELLVLAQRRGLRIHEVPVDWVDDPDSRVRIVRTAIDDLRGVARLAAASPLARFLGIGVVSTALFALLFLVLRGPLGAAGANAVALALTAVGNTAANRRFTFRLRGRTDLRPPPPARRRGLRAHAGAVQRGARRAARHRRHAGARGRADRAGAGEPRRDRHPLRGAEDVGLRTAPPSSLPDPPGDHPMKKRTFTRVAVFGSAAALGLAGCGEQAATSSSSSGGAANQPAAGQTQGQRPDLSALAKELGVSETKLQKAMEATRPTDGSQPSSDPSAALAKELGLDADKVREAMQDFMPQGGPPSGVGQPPSGGGQQPPSSSSSADAEQS